MSMDIILETLIRENRYMADNKYNSYTSYTPFELDIAHLPVKYGMSDYDRAECEGHNPSWKSTNDFPEWNVRSHPIEVIDGCVYFAGPDGFVWYCPDLSELPDQSYFKACATYSVAAFDLWHHDANVPHEVINYGWYLARRLSDLHFRMNGH